MQFSFFLFIFLSVFFTNNAMAYMDPGTGSFILQLLMGGVAGAYVGAKMYWHKVKAFFVKAKKSNK